MPRISDEYLDNVANGKQTMATHTAIAGEKQRSAECPEFHCPECPESNNFIAQNA